MGKRIDGLEVCEYCDISYHPMMRWTKLGSGHVTDMIFVHQYTFDFDSETKFLVLDDTCEKKAAADGYEPRPDLTPKR